MLWRRRWRLLKKSSGAPAEKDRLLVGSSLHQSGAKKHSCPYILKIREHLKFQGPGDQQNSKQFKMGTINDTVNKSVRGALYSSRVCWPCFILFLCIWVFCSRLGVWSAVGLDPGTILFFGSASPWMIINKIQETIQQTWVHNDFEVKQAWVDLFRHIFHKSCKRGLSLVHSNQL